MTRGPLALSSDLAKSFLIRDFAIAKAWANHTANRWQSDCPCGSPSTHMLRIERTDEGAETTLRATGRLTGPWVAEFEKVLSDYATDTPVVIDLTEVSFVDRAGIALLRMLRSRTQVKLRCSAFVAEQIN
jgi:hypothetical protein